MNYEILNESGEVINVIIASEKFVEKHYPGRYRLAPEPEPVPESFGTKLSPLAFQRRFTPTERRAIRQLAKANTATGQAAEDFLELSKIARNVDLTDPDVVAALSLFESENVLTQGRAEEILNTAVTQEELP